jgi:hypothetical protein
MGGSATPKGQKNLFIYLFYIFFFNFTFGGGRSTPNGNGSHPKPPLVGGRSHPVALGGGLAHPKGQTHFKNNFFLGSWGWPNHPQGPCSGFGHLRPFSHPMAQLRWPATPLFLFFILILIFLLKIKEYFINYL